MKEIITWNDLTYHQFKEISNLGELSEEDKIIELMRIIYGEDVLNLPITQFQEKAKNIKLDEKIPSSTAHRKYIINGREYEFDISPENITTAQYIDYSNFIKAKNTEAAIAVFLIPIGSKYNDDTYKLDEVIKGIDSLPCTDVLDMGNFMERCLLAFTTIFQFSLHKKIKRDKTMKKEQKKKILEQLNRLMSYNNLV